MKKLIVSALIVIGFLAMSPSAFACSITPFSFDTGITPARFQDPRYIADAASWCDLLQVVSNVIGLLYSVVIPIAILMVTLGGAIILTSGGNDKRLSQGKGFIKSALIGVVIALGAGLLISFILRGLGVTDLALFPWLF